MGILYLGNQKVTPFVYENATKYGASVNTFLGDTNNSGVLQTPSSQTDVVFSGVNDVATNALIYVFAYSCLSSISFPQLTSLSGSTALSYMCSNITSLFTASFPVLQTISGSNACNGAFSNSYITSISMPQLTTVSGHFGIYYLCQNARNLTSCDFSNLEAITGGSGAAYIFYGCCSLTSITFPKLETLTGNGVLMYGFAYATKLEDIYFPSLKTTSFGNSYTNQFNGMLMGTGTTVTHTIHFPSNLESTIQGLTGYPLFGGTSGYVVLSFDLPATE